MSLAAGLLLAAALAGSYLLAISGWRDLNRMIDLTAQRRSARIAILQTARTFSLLKDLETGARGYLLTGRIEYLEPYDVARSQLPDAYAKLKMEAINVPSGFSWREIDALTNRRLDTAARIVQFRQQVSRSEKDEAALLDQGKATMDAIREELSRLDRYQSEEIHRLDGEVARLQTRGAWFALTGSALVTLLLVATVLMLWREFQRRRQSEQALEELNDHLEVLVAERTTELNMARERLSAFAEIQAREIEAERGRLAREVHDQIGQVFTAVKLILDSGPSDTYPADQRKALDTAINAGIATTRRIATELHPPLLDDLGLQAAFEFFLEKLLAGHGPAWRVDVRDPKILDIASRLVLFRIAQEAVTNVLRHAPRATRLDIHGWSTGDLYRLEIEDNGGGFDIATVRPGAMGLLGMRERIALAGGRIEISTGEGRSGTLIAVEIPLTRKDS